MSYAKDAKQLIRTIEHQPGVEVRQNGAGHYSVYKDDKFVTSISVSPSDHRWRDHAIADLRRAGITPSVKPQRAHIEPKQLMPTHEIIARIKSLESQNAFARFCAEDLQAVYPHDRTRNAIQVSLSEVSRGSKQLSPRYHELFDAAFRTWDKINGQQQKIEPVGPITPQSIDADKETPVPQLELVEILNEPDDQYETWKKLVDAVEQHQEALEAVVKRVNRLESVSEREVSDLAQAELRSAYAAALLANVEKGYVNEAVLQRLDKLVGS
jgi:hypothetical protein